MIKPLFYIDLKLGQGFSIDKRRHVRNVVFVEPTDNTVDAARKIGTAKWEVAL